MKLEFGTVQIEVPVPFFSIKKNMICWLLLIVIGGGIRGRGHSYSRENDLFYTNLDVQSAGLVMNIFVPISRDSERSKF